MTITCPSCDASYRLKPEALGAGRLVRCARCKTEWFAEGAGTSLVAEPMTSLEPSALEPIEGLDDAVAIDAIESPDPLALEPEYQPARRVSTAKSWFPRRAGRDAKARSTPDRLKKISSFKLRPIAAVAAVGCIAVAALIGERVEVVRAAPSLASLYGRIGLAVNVRGLSIDEVRSVERIEEGVPLLLVRRREERVRGRRGSAATEALDHRRPFARALRLDHGRGAGQIGAGRKRAVSRAPRLPAAEGQGLTVRFVGQADLARPGH